MKKIYALLFVSLLLFIGYSCEDGSLSHGDVYIPDPVEESDEDDGFATEPTTTSVVRMSIGEGHQHQMIDGFGCGFAEWSHRIWNNNHRDAVMADLFGDNGLKLNIFRGEVFPHPYNIDAIRDTPECILVEGEFDALSYMAVGRTDVISVPNGANSQLDWLDELSESHFEQKQVIYLSVDTDRKGRELCRELSRRLGVDRCRIVTYGEAYKDANELLVAEGPDALLKALEDAPIPRLEGTFTAEDLREGLHQLFEEGYTSGVELGIPNLDEIMRLETGRVLTVTGIPGHGKSDFVDEIVLRLCTRQDWRAGYFSPENTPIEYHHAKLAEKLLGHRFRKDFSTEEEFARVVDYLSQRVWHILPDGDFTLGNVLSKARELVHRHGIRVFVIDPYNYINHQIPAGMTETGYIGSFMNSLARFARLNSCLVILVAHPRKMNKQYGTQKTEVPTMYDINGSANFFNMTDYGIVVDRQDEMGIVYIHVEKTRFRNFGTKGNAAFCYDVTNGRYSPCTPPPEPGMQVQPWKGAKDLFSSEGWI